MFLQLWYIFKFIFAFAFSDKSTGIVNLRPGPGPSGPKIDFESEEKMDEQNWFMLWYELKTYKAPWKTFGLKKFLLLFLVAFIHFLLSNYDVYSGVHKS